MKDLFLIGSVPGWVIVLVALVAAALLVQQFLSLKQRLTIGHSSFLVFLRTCVYGLLIFFLLGPAVVDKRVTKLRRPLTVLLDSSQSMAFPASAKPTQDGKPGKSRFDVMREALLDSKDPLIQKLNRDYDLRVFRFGTSLEPIAPASISQLKPQDQGTRLLELLQTAASDAGAQSGILLFTDGITNGDKKSLEGSPALPVPIFAVGLGETEGFTDVRIADVRAPEFAFRGRELKLDLTVQAYGLKGKTFPLYFNRGKNLITSRSINVDADPYEQKITLSFMPKELGTHSFSLSIPVQPGEQLTQNNQKEFKVDVQRPENQLSLIPFPIDDIFLEELKNFDVLVFDDFSHRSYFNPVYLDKVRDFVRDGGGLAMFGGSRSFDSGGYADSSLKDVLPVELDGKGSYQTQSTVQAVLTASGKAHPVTRLLPDPKSNQEAWAKMPPLTALNQVRSARGETLLSAGGNGSGAAAPLLTIGRFGKGRTLAFMSDDAWRWNFIAVGNHETPQNHLKLIRQAIRWLAQEPSFEQVQIQPIPASRPAEKIVIKLRVLKDDFTPTGQASVQVRVFGPEGEPSLLSATATSEEGEYTAEYTPTKEGSYRIEAEANLAGKTLGKDRTSFSVAFPYGEIDDGRPRNDLLKQIAETSHGEYFSINDWNDQALQKIAAKLESHAPSQIVEQRQTRLWSTLWPFSIILVLLSIEWWMRRKWGLI